MSALDDMLAAQTPLDRVVSWAKLATCDLLPTTDEQRRTKFETGEMVNEAREELASLRARVSALEGALRHAIQSSHGHKPDACSACSAADTLLQPPTPTETK